MWSVEDGVLRVPGDATCAEVEAAAAPWLFSSDRPDLTVDEWIGRGGGDLLWGLLGPTRAQVLGIAARLADGRVVRFGGRVVKNVAGYDLTRAFVGARGELGTVTEAFLRLRPPPRGWRAGRRYDTERDEARRGAGCAVWDGGTTRFLRRGEALPEGYAELDPAEARALLRPAWQEVVSFVPEGDGVLLAGPGVVGSRAPAEPDRGPLWATLVGALR